MRKNQELTLRYYTVYGIKQTGVIYKCPLCQRELTMQKGSQHNNDILGHIEKFHYELSDRWTENLTAHIQPLEQAITQIWKLENKLAIIDIIAKILNEKALLNEHTYEFQVNIIKHEINKLREFAYALTS